MMKTRISQRHFQVISSFLLFGTLLVVYFYHSTDFRSSRKQLQIPNKHVVSNDTAPYDALILGYMRSGSSFIGKLLGWRTDTFYWYEPLWKTHKWEYLSDGQTVCSVRNSSCRHAKSAGESLRFLSDIYKCNNLAQYYNRFTKAMQGSPNFTGSTGQVFSSCISAIPLCRSCATGTCRKVCKRHLGLCYQKQIQLCPKAKHRVTKVLRMGTMHAQFLLERNERLKVVQIFRDPRAIISSRIKTTWYYKDPSRPETDAQILCKRLQKDIENAEQLRQKYPNRVKIIQYEDFYNKARMSTALYSFLNMDMDDSVPNFNDKNSKRGFHPDSYRSHLNWSLIEAMQRPCHHVIGKLGLSIFENANDFKNTNIPLVFGNLPYKIE